MKGFFKKKKLNENSEVDSITDESNQANDADKNDIKKQKEPKNKSKDKSLFKSFKSLKSGKASKDKINKIFATINTILLLLIASQVYLFFSNMSDMHASLKPNGRFMSFFLSDDRLELTTKNLEELPELLQKKLGESGLTKSEPKEETKQATTEDSQADIISKKGDLYKKANLSIIVTELGLREEDIELANELPEEVAFAFSPYSDRLQEKINAALDKNRQVLMNIYMEPSSYPLKDTGPFTIQGHYEETQNIFRLQSSVNGITGYTGFLTNHDEVVTHNFDKVQAILTNIKSSNKFFAYYLAPSNSYLDKEAKPLALDIVEVAYLVDEALDENSIKERLRDILLNLVNDNRRMVITIRSSKLTVGLLKEWLQKHNEKIRLAPISYFVTEN